MRRTQPTTKKVNISSKTHVQMLQWLHGKQQQHLEHPVARPLWPRRGGNKFGWFLKQQPGSLVCLPMYKKKLVSFLY